MDPSLHHWLHRTAVISHVETAEPTPVLLLGGDGPPGVDGWLGEQVNALPRRIVNSQSLDIVALLVVTQTDPLHLVEISHRHPEAAEHHVVGELTPAELVEGLPAHDLVHTGRDEQILV